MINLKIDPEFQSQIPPLTDDEFKQLEENILKEGKLLSPLIVWNNTLVDGHNRYAILQKHPEIYFSTMPLPFESREEVLAWICKNQLGRRNLTPEQKKFLIGKQYSVEHRKPGGNGNNQHTAAAKKTAPEELCQIDTASVLRASHYTRGIDIADNLSPGIKQKVFSGEVKFTNEEMSKLVQVSVRASFRCPCSNPACQRHWKCWNLPVQNLNLKKQNPFPCPHHKQKNSGAIMCRTSL